MLIVNGDDWGRSTGDTDTTLACLEGGRCTSVSAMVFMADSERAAAIANDKKLDVGLHLNFSEKLNSGSVTQPLQEAHTRVMRFLRSSKYAQILYNPFLRQDFDYVSKAQLDEFGRLYSSAPTHVDGHQHLHLCANMLLQHPIPGGGRMRRSFSFQPGEKSPFNRAYRGWVDRRLAKRYRITDYFFALSSSMKASSIARIADLSRNSIVELMTHPRIVGELEFLLGGDFGEITKALNMAGHSW